MRGSAFIVNVDGAAASRHGAVVHHCALVTSYPATQEPSKGRSFLAVEIGFQPVTDGFVQQDPRPTRTHYDFHFPGRRLARVELNNALASGFLGEVLGSLFVLEKVQGHPAAAAEGAAR